MNREKIRDSLDPLIALFAKIAEPAIQAAIGFLLNLVESLLAENETHCQTIQEQADEINRLKGEQGKPKIRPQKKNSQGNHSSEEERKKRRKQNGEKLRKKKKGTITVDRTVVCPIDKQQLPEDAQSKGYKTIVIQDLKVVTDNVEFQREVYYSRSLNKTFIAPLPKGYEGEFGPGIKALSLALYHGSNMTAPALKDFFTTSGSVISTGTISRMLTDNHDVFHQEKEDIVDAGLQAPYQQTDDTGARVNGKNHHVHILCNPFYTAYFTRLKKDRLTILEIFSRDELKFSINQSSFELMKNMGLSEKRLQQLIAMNTQEVLTRVEIDGLLKQLFPDPKKHQTNRRCILEASALVYYHRLEHAIKHLICDDAPQFNHIAQHKSLCWIHEGRHYKKLKPYLSLHREALDAFITKFWDFYQCLLDYTEQPTPPVAVQLNDEFDCLFSTTTGYDLLDERIALTKDKKEALLLPLRFPFLPLHNNDSEGGAQHQARLRDIHLQTRNEKGTRAKDTFATIVKTARKLQVNVYNYFYDRMTQSFSMPSLAHLILEKCKLQI